MRNLLLLLCLCLSSILLFSQTDPLTHLEQEIERLEKLSGGSVGVGLIQLESDRLLMYNDEEVFPMASSYKIPIAVKLLQRVEAGDFGLDTLIELTESDIHPGSGTISQLLNDPGVALSARNLLELMMLISDNSATDLCMKLAGGPEAINGMLMKNGLNQISVDRPTVVLIANWLGIEMKADEEMGMEVFMKKAEALDEATRTQANKMFVKDNRDQSSPRHMAYLLRLLWEGKLLNPAHTELLLDIMYRCETGENRLKGILPPGTSVAHKTGTIGGTTNDVGIIDLPGEAGHVVCVVFIKESSISVAEREKVIAHIARAAYDYFLFRP